MDKSIICLMLLITLGVTIEGVRELQHGEACNTSSRWKADACNWCNCVDKKTNCTTRDCSTYQIGYRGECEVTVVGSKWRTESEWYTCERGRGVLTSTPSEKTDNIECVGAPRWKKVCNYCSCVRGFGRCTRIGCVTGRPGIKVGRSVRQVSTHELGSRCLNDHEWQEDCNLCWCEHGVPHCSQNECGDNTTAKDEVATPSKHEVPITIIDATATCIVGSRWREECNWCSCSPNGINSFCTLKGCIPGGSSSEKECTDNSRWKKDNCNWCSCIDGKADCSQNDCNAVPVMSRRTSLHNVEVRPRVIECTNGSRWVHKCNRCRCLMGLAVCTKRGCPDGSVQDELEGKCEGDSNWKIKCNWCTCKNGRGECTSDDCNAVSKDIQGQRVSTTPITKDCDAGSRWRFMCNWCTCSGGRPSCTKMICGGRPDKLLNHCDPGSRWKKDGCNWCSCVEGRAACTEKACLTVDLLAVHAERKKQQTEQQSSVNESCTTGSGWRKQCNWCTCRNGVGACTKKLCRPGQTYDDRKQCDNNSKWLSDDGCNWCSCHNGLSACTVKACLSESLLTVHLARKQLQHNQSQPEEPPTGQPKPTADCTIGSSWRQHCNICRCNNGKGTCTKRGCLPGYTSEEPECDGDSQWRSNCNWCTCSEGKSVCTQRVCINRNEYVGGDNYAQATPHSAGAGIASVMPLITRESNEEIDDQTLDSDCDPGSRWNEDCNECQCSERGFSMCTEKACNSGRHLSDGKCTGTSRWKDDCNWCNCVNGRAVCTEIACGSADGGCVEGSSWYDGCNNCGCNNGYPICTQRYCFTEPLRAKSLNPTNPQCIEGQRWMDECNSCVCKNGISGCTQKDCSSLPTLPDLCHLPFVQSQCFGYFQRWTFDSKSLLCNKVIYGGCGGNKNLFETEEQCQAACPVSAPREGRQTITSKCSKKPDSGLCFADIVRYGYVSERDRCEKFTYGGCQGNENNFISPEECYDTCGGDPPVIDSECDRNKCDWQILDHYLAKDCKPQYTGGACCPTSFTCRSEEDRGLLPNICYYQEKEFNIGDSVPITDSCSARCRCVQGFPANSTAKINCAGVECPSLFRRPEPGCRELYQAGKCCSYKTECEDPNVPLGLQSRSPVCTWDHKTYKLGDKMYFNDDYADCQTCICTPGFTDPFGPGCTKVDCGFEFRYRSNFVSGCVPIYFERKCCPIDWLCPGDSRLLIEGNVGAVPKPPPQDNQQNTPGSYLDECHLGNYSVPLGGAANISQCRIQCRCLVPPELTCVQYRDCTRSNASLRPVCKKLNCPPGCGTRPDSLTGCPACSCGSLVVSCREPTCPVNCKNPQILLDRSTGCQKCQCECQHYREGKPLCPVDCITHVVFNEEEGCNVCQCDPSNANNPLIPNPLPVLSQCPKANCPADCAVKHVHDPTTGCSKCICSQNRCPIDPGTGSPPCPKNCKNHETLRDFDSGCMICICNDEEQIGEIKNCLKDPHTGRAPCPVDCRREYATDLETGCETCSCVQRREGPVGPSLCRVHASTGKPPCPFDCGIIFITNENTGCKECVCDPRNSGNPFTP